MLSKKHNMGEIDQNIDNEKTFTKIEHYPHPYQIFDY